jgi:hypothetical protein
VLSGSPGFPQSLGSGAGRLHKILWKRGVFSLYRKAFSGV